MSEKIWIGYDNLDIGPRFFVFLFILAIPYSVIATFNFPMGLAYAACLLSWRHTTIWLYKRKIKNETKIKNF